MSHPSDLLPFIAAADGGIELWSMCAFGPRENGCAMVASGLGGHVRVGFENNLFAPDGALAQSNAAQVQRVAQGAALLGRPVADAQTARGMLVA